MRVTSFIDTPSDGRPGDFADSDPGGVTRYGPIRTGTHRSGSSISA
jgi:hypothetical protein